MTLPTSETRLFPTLVVQSDAKPGSPGLTGEQADFAAALALLEQDGRPEEDSPQSDAEASEPEFSSSWAARSDLIVAISQTGARAADQDQEAITRSDRLQSSAANFSHSGAALSSALNPSKDELTWPTPDVVSPFDMLTGEDGSDVRPQASERLAPDQQAFVIHVDSIETHLPGAIAHYLPLLLGSSAPPPDEPVGQAQRSLTHAERSPLRVLQFEIEPASLGSILVRMRMTASRVEIEMDAQSSSTAALLQKTQESLASAIADRGYSLDALEIQVSQPTAMADMRQENAGPGRAASSQLCLSGEGASRHDEQSRGGSGRRQEREQAPAEDRVGGVRRGVFL